MIKTMLWAVAGYFLASAAVMWAAPQPWFDAVPGVAATGGYNAHFIRDLALAFAVSGLALATGAAAGDRRLALFGAAWPCLHALFHIWIWGMHRGAALDLVALVNLAGIQLPGWLALVCAAHLPQEEALA